MNAEEISLIMQYKEVTENILKQNRGKEELYYLFLDFDGVINVFYMPGTPEYEAMIRKENFEFADRKCVERLNAICRDYPIRVVISSSWRFSGLKNCRDYLLKAGMSEDVQIVGLTQTEVYQSRELDILQYVYEHADCSGYIIFDDGNMPHLSEHFVLTNPLKGWDEERDSFARTLLEMQK